MTKQEAINYANELLSEKYGLRPLSNSEVRDFDFIDGDTEQEVEMWINDYASEVYTEIAAEKQAWRYQH